MQSYKIKIKYQTERKRQYKYVSCNIDAVTDSHVWSWPKENITRKVLQAFGLTEVLEILEDEEKCKNNFKIICNPITKRFRAVNILVCFLLVFSFSL